MRIHEVVLELMVKDVGATVEFYEQKLGFSTLVKEPASGAFTWAKMQLGNFQISFKEENTLKDEVSLMANQAIGGSAILCILLEEGIQTYYERLQGDVQIVNPLHFSACGMNEFSILDNNGYLITVDQPGACVV